MTEQRIVRTKLKFEREFTQIPNDWVRDGKLSLKARGLLAVLMSHDPEFVVSVRQLLASNPEGRDAIDGAIRELRRHGYLEVRQLRSREGKLNGTLWELTDPAEVMRRRAAQPELWDAVPPERKPRKRVRVQGNRMPVEPHAGNPAHGTPLLKDQLNSSIEGDHSTRVRADEDASAAVPRCSNGHLIVGRSGADVPFCALGCAPVLVDA